eukprot:CAMPEP_0117765338 /NCGR_PEP_ID=MMETSP0947-20121206/20044_1 /TAXON_ID=44440 /ORGANISM="Chattonella subsalsa, Strain CCMP2191" /LENGTH=238 /DNA_ID=CAMNT_0005587957 /DNA_START=201 /DNA_END=917 /DNA_ORIENTATION=+
MPVPSPPQPLPGAPVMHFVNGVPVAAYPRPLPVVPCVDLRTVPHSPLAMGNPSTQQNVRSPVRLPIGADEVEMAPVRPHGTGLGSKEEAPIEIIDDGSDSSQEEAYSKTKHVIEELADDDSRTKMECQSSSSMTLEDDQGSLDGGVIEKPIKIVIAITTLQTTKLPPPRMRRRVNLCPKSLRKAIMKKQRKPQVQARLLGLAAWVKELSEIFLARCKMKGETKGLVKNVFISLPFQFQ